MGECCLSPGGPAASSPASEGPSGLRRRILGRRQRASQQMDTARPVCCCKALEPLIMRAGFSLLSLCLSSAPFEESPQTVWDYGLGPLLALLWDIRKGKKADGLLCVYSNSDCFSWFLGAKK